MIDKTAIFLGKFQPPHLGHIRTILRIKDEYKRLIIGVTEDKKILDSDEVVNIFKEVFKEFKNIDIKLIRGIVENDTAILPKNIDIVLSGNYKVLDKLSERYDTRFVPRTQGIGYSATEIRKIAMGSKSISINKSNIDLKMELINISQLRPLEKVLPSHLKNIKNMIEKDNKINKPLIVDKKDKIVLDGSHRYAYLYKEGYNYAPAILVDYEDEAIFVGNHLKHRFIKDNSFTISKQEVRNRAINENLYPPRTTRHFFPFRKVDYPVELKLLEKGDKQRSIEHLLEKILLEDEIAMDRNYIDEIDEEIKIIKKYLDEQYETKEYLLSQIKMMENNDQ